MKGKEEESCTGAHCAKQYGSCHAMQSAQYNIIAFLWFNIITLLTCRKNIQTLGTLNAVSAYLLAIASENWQHSWCHGTFSMVREDASDFPQYVTDFISMKSNSCVLCVVWRREKESVEKVHKNTIRCYLITCFTSNSIIKVMTS